MRELYTSARLREVSDGFATGTRGIETVDDDHVVLGVEAWREIEKDKVVHVYSSRKMFGENTKLGIVTGKIELYNRLIYAGFPRGHLTSINFLALAKKSKKRRGQVSVSDGSSDSVRAPTSKQG